MSLPNLVADQCHLIGGRYELGKALGKGGYATVFSGVDTKIGRPVALKRLRKSPKSVQLAMSEVVLTSTVQHPNIVRIYDIIHEEEYIYIAMELCKQTLFDRLSSKPLKPEELFTIFHQVVSAVSKLHDAGICHRDIKLENIMIGEDGTVKLIDFGLATNKPLGTSRCGSPHYMAPELWKTDDEAYDGMKADSWSVGCVLFCMLFRKMPFMESSVDLRTKILTRSCAIPALASDCTTINPKQRELLGQLLEKDAMKRLSVKAIASHPYWISECRQYNLGVAGIDCAMIEQLPIPSVTISSSMISSSSTTSSASSASSSPNLKSTRRRRNVKNMVTDFDEPSETPQHSPRFRKLLRKVFNTSDKS